VYRELTRQSDCQVPDRRPGMPATATINLLGPGEDELRCFGTGLLHANYRFLGAPARPRADSQPGAHAANPARRNSVP
jgi:hypothetical protein